MRVILFSHFMGDGLGDRTFRCNARAFFLTYPRCGIPGKELLDKLCHVESSWVYITVGEESHSNGEAHRHALVVCSKKRDLRSATYFDIDGFHPNVQSARNIHDVIAYVQKVTQPSSFNIRRISSSRLEIARRERVLIGELLFRAVTPPPPSLL